MMTCCQVVALLLLSFLPSAAAAALVPALFPQPTLQLAKGWLLSQSVLELTTCCDDACSRSDVTLVPQRSTSLMRQLYPNGTHTLSMASL